MTTMLASGIMAGWLAVMPGVAGAEDVVQTNKADRVLYQQKSLLVDQILTQPDLAKRVVGTDAQPLLEQARQSRDQARQAMESNKATEARTLMDQALKLALDASRRTVRPESQAWLQRARYDDLSLAVGNLVEAYQRHLEHAGKNANSGSPARIRQMLVDARQLTTQDKYQEANALLEDARKQVVAGLKSLLDSKSLVYELKFASPEEEYKYEMGRSESFQALLRMTLLAGEKNLPGQSRQRDVEEFIARSQTLMDTAKQQAGQGAFKDAVSSQEKANMELVKGLRILGVSLPF
ncbi:MAG: hypothetical protein H7833_15560 [Magnetococcus sp. DMHC-1]|nr:hypothetical protein [Magnetococcales bacterium]